ncbi:MAG TPA: preprotein translocase subunit SecE [Solirubrobacteraceae bacterium]|nr:preprotein translocase subunit SecE [Solirubrobacteraceae bacterium]
MARNRKQRRSTRRPASGSGARPGVATARGPRGEDHEETPSPLEHATPDAELAEAQLARGRDGAPSADSEDEGTVYADEVTSAEADDDADAALVRTRGATVSESAAGGNRLINFLRGSWRELQRVQWPDRRQVMQATGVVLGFVVVAGLYLGLADTVASKLADLILK